MAKKERHEEAELRDRNITSLDGLAVPQLVLTAMHANCACHIAKLRLTLEPALLGSPLCRGCLPTCLAIIDGSLSLQHTVF